MVNRNFIVLDAKQFRRQKDVREFYQYIIKHDLRKEALLLIKKHLSQEKKSISYSGIFGSMPS